MRWARNNDSAICHLPADTVDVLAAHDIHIAAVQPPPSSRRAYLFAANGDHKHDVLSAGTPSALSFVLQDWEERAALRTLVTYECAPLPSLGYFSRVAIATHVGARRLHMIPRSSCDTASYAYMNTTSGGDPGRAGVTSVSRSARLAEGGGAHHKRARAHTATHTRTHAHICTHMHPRLLLGLSPQRNVLPYHGESHPQLLLGREPVRYACCRDACTDLEKRAIKEGGLCE